jgi:hypothetical protein
MGQQVVQLLDCWVMYCILFFLRETLDPVENCLFHVSSSEKKVVKPVHIHLNQTHIHTSKNVCNRPIMISKIIIRN